MDKNLESLAILFKDIYSDDPENLPKALQALKDKRASQIESVKILISSLGLSLKEADDLVRESEAWSSTKKMTDEVRSSFWDTLENFEG